MSLKADGSVTSSGIGLEKDGPNRRGNGYVYVLFTTALEMKEIEKCGSMSCKDV